MGQIMGKAKNKQGEGKPKHKPKPATKPHHHKSVSAHKPSKAVNSVPVTALGLAATGGIELRAAVANATTPWAGFSADVPPPLRCEAGARTLLPARLPNEVETESPAAFCARRAAQNLKLGRGDLADKLAVAEGKLLKHTQPHVQSNTWSNNLGNAFYCVADLIALYTACGIAPTRAARGVLNGSFASWARTLRNDPERRRSPACAAAVLCRDFGGGSKGACWDAYAYAPVLPDLSQAFHKRIHHMIGPKARARPCGLPVPPPPSPMPPPMPPAGQAGNALSALSGAAADAAAASASPHVRARVGTGIVYMRCGDYLARRRGHVLLRLDWLDAFAATAFSSVARVGIVSNRKTHGLGGHNTPQVRLQHPHPNSFTQTRTVEGYPHITSTSSQLLPPHPSCLCLPHHPPTLTPLITPLLPSLTVVHLLRCAWP